MYFIASSCSGWSRLRQTGSGQIDIVSPIRLYAELGRRLMTLTDDAANSGPGGADPARERLLSAPRQILDGLPDAVLASARDGQIVFVNAVAEELFGYRREELLGR